MEGVIGKSYGSTEDTSIRNNGRQVSKAGCEIRQVLEHAEWVLSLGWLKASGLLSKEKVL